MGLKKLTEVDESSSMLNNAHVVITQQEDLEGIPTESIRRATVQAIVSTLRSNGINSGYVTDEALTDMYSALVQKVETVDGGIKITYWDGFTEIIEISSGGLSFKTGEVDSNGYFHLLDENGNDVDGFEPFFIGTPGGSGGSAASSTVVLTRTGSKTISVASGYSCPIQFNATSTIDGQSTGDMTVDVTVNGVVAFSKDIQQGANSVEVKDYVRAGANTVLVTVTDSYGNYRSLTYTANIVELSIESTFDNSSAFTDGFTFKYTVYGEGSKTVHFLIDGVQAATVAAPFSNRQYSKEFEKLSDGEHILDVYVTATVGGASITSNHLRYALVCTSSSSSSVIIACPFNKTTARQGDLLTFNWSIYDPNNLTATVQLKVNDTVVNTVTVDRTPQTWNIKDYPSGTVKFSIVCGSVKKEFTVTVSEFVSPVSAVSTGLSLHLKSANRSNSEATPNTLVYENITTTFNDFNFITNGWIDDESGDTALRINNTAQAVVNYNPFTTDCKPTGKALEFEFAVRDVLNYEIPLISCWDDDYDIGFRIYANYIEFKSAQTTVKTYFREDVKIRLSIVIEDVGSDRLLSIYVNGIHSGVQQYPVTDSFRQPTPKPITIGSGSSSCGIDFYALRVYDNDLTRFEVLDNYIADRTDTSELLDLFEENDIYDDYGNIVYSKVLSHLPCATITGPLSTSKSDTKVGTPLEFDDAQHPERSYVTGDGESEDKTENVVQGTSSAVLPTKNFKIKHKSGITYKQSGDYSSKFYITPGAIGEKTCCLKANYMESSNSYNTTMAQIIASLMPKIPQQLVDERVRSTVYGFPIVLFNKPDSNSERVFKGIYDFNNDKSNSDTFGCGGNWPNAEIIEFCNNTSPACLFQSKTFSEGDFESRYPDTDDPDYTAFKTFHNWIVDNDISAYTGDDLDDDVEIEGVTYSTDSLEYRIAKFREEAPSHMDVDAFMSYYLAADFFIMADNLAKNLFPGTDDTTALAVKYFLYPYDMDTILGLNNEGVPSFSYDVEIHDRIGGAAVYNGESSTLWKNMELAYMDEMKAKYKTWRSSGLLSYNTVLNFFNTITFDKLPAALYNEDAYEKYIKTFKNGLGDYLFCLQGNRLEFIKYMLLNRFRYVDGKYEAGDYMNNYIVVRLYTPEGNNLAIEPNFDFDITSYMSGYFKVSYGGKMVSVRQSSKNAVTHITAPTAYNDNTGEYETIHFNNTECFVYGYGITDIGDLAPKYPSGLNVSKATSLTRVKVGDTTEGYSNPNLLEAKFGTNPLLTYINLANCPNLTNSIDVSGCKNIEEINAIGTAITGFTLPVGGNLKKLYLPATITNLTIINHRNLSVLSVAGYTNLQTLRLEGFPLDISTILHSATNLNVIRLVDVSVIDTNLDLLEDLKDLYGLDENGGEVSYPVLTGLFQVNGTIKMSDKVMYEDIYPGLTVTATTIVDDVLYDKDGNVVVDSENNVIVLPNNSAYHSRYTVEDFDDVIEQIAEDIEELEQNESEENENG